MSWSLPSYENHQRHGEEIIEVRELHGNQENTIEIMNQDVGKSSGNKKRRKGESKVWEEMTKYKGEDGMVRAKCIHCEKVFDGSSKKGTTHLKNHLLVCRRKRNGGEDAVKSKKTRDLTSSIVSKEKSVIDLIKNCFDEKGHPTEDWNPSILSCRKIDVLQVFEGEKEDMRRFLSKLTCRFSLRIEWFWHWCLLTVHYIDDGWEPKRKIISFKNSIRYEYVDVIAILKESCLDWKIDGSICSIVNDYHNNDKDDDDDDDIIGEINSWFIQRSSLPFSGVLFSIEALSHIFSTLYAYMEYCVWDRFNGIKKCIDYIFKTPSNRRKFAIAARNVKSMGKKVTLRELTRTFLFRDFEDSLGYKILGDALGYKEAFCELEEIDPDFKSINLTKEQWDEATMAYQYVEQLKVDIDHSVSEIKAATPNMYFPKFCSLYMKLLAREKGEVCHPGNLTSPVIEEFVKIVQKKREDFEKYWRKYNLVIVVLVVLDPRYKMDIVKRWYIKIYGNDADRYFNKTIEDFTVVYNKYAKVFEFGETTSSTSYLDDLGMLCTASDDVPPRSELQCYWNDPKFPRIEKFDVLAWWRVNTPNFPTLARMARDFLAIPISVSAATSFSMVDVNVTECVGDCEVIDNNIKSALLCLRRWWGKY